MTDSDSPNDSPERVPLRSSDLPLLLILAFAQGAVLLSLPVAAWFIARFLNSWPGERRPGYLVPILVVVVAAVEYGLFLRFRRLWRRIRGGPRP